MKDDTKYTVDYFIKKFEAIPTKQWCKGSFNNRESQHCALGHCGAQYFTSYSFSSVVQHTAESSILSKLIKTQASIGIVELNDGSVEAKRLFPNKTIKGRVLAALYTIKLMQEAGLPPNG